MKTGIIRYFVAPICVLTVFMVARAEDYFESYKLSPYSPVVDLGVQPLSYPSGVVSAAMRHDRILKKALTDHAQGFMTHPFLRSGDMLGLITDHRLEAGMFGDISTIHSASGSHIWIVGLIEQVSTAIVAKGATTVQGLAGKRVGYVEASTAHYILLQGLASAGLSEDRITLVRLRIDEMPEALERGDIDAFAGWDPATSTALRNSEKNHIVFRGLSTDYFVIERDFEKRAPDAARHLVAGLFRAVEWMRRSQQNLEKAVRWAMADAEAFSGKPEKLSPSEIAALTRRNLLNVPSSPAIVRSAGAPPLKDAFQFLMKQGKLPPDTMWGNVEASFSYNGLARVLAEPGSYRLSAFDYED